MITEYLREEQISHTINRVIVARHDVTVQYLCVIEDSKGNELKAFKLIDHGATGEVDSMPYEMLRNLLALRPVPMDKCRHPTKSELASIKEYSRPRISEADKNFIYLCTSDPSTAKFCNERETPIVTINIFDDIKVIVNQAGGTMPDKKGDITFEHFMDSFELSVRNPFMEK